MCGLTGYWDLARESGGDQLRATIARMAATLRHRGPDDEGVWVDPAAGIALGFRRLSILDLSAEGRQPMQSAGGRYVVLFNGEIYNFQALRQELEARGDRFRGHSDTEVLLAAVSRWGLEAALERFNGMFAFALWDRERRVLHLVRDRLGEKPLYYGWIQQTLLFGSELKALRAHPSFQPEIDRNALALYVRYSCVPTPHSIYRGIYKLPPGTILTLDERSIGADPRPVAYWSVREVAERGVAEPFAGPPGEAAAHLEELLSDAIRLRMIADVPLGAFLSGGIDSTTVVALMQAHSARAVKTFSIGFEDPDYNEAAHAAAVARHLGADHTELVVTPAEAMAVIPRLPALYDEPFADPSQIPTFLVAELARRAVTVSLSGDGGDELFAGYNRYRWGTGIWPRVARMPRALRAAAAAGIGTVAPATWTSMFAKVNAVLPPRLRPRSPGDKLHKLAAALSVDDPETAYLGLTSHWMDASLVVGASNASVPNGSREPELPTAIHQMMYRDTVAYLPDDILVKVDRATMGVSLEARIPLLDHRVVEFAWRLPVEMKIRAGESKWVLRQLAYQYVPRELLERPKAGFAVQIDTWLRGPLRGWAEELLSERRLGNEGFFRPQPIRARWTEHLSGQRNWADSLWGILMFEAWLRDTDASTSPQSRTETAYLPAG